MARERRSARREHASRGARAASRACRCRQRRERRGRLDHWHASPARPGTSTRYRSRPSRSRRRRGTRPLRAIRGRGSLQAPAAGEAQSVQLAHLLETRFGVRLAPSAREVRRSCTCPDDEPLGACKHIAALAFVVADAIDRDPSLFLLWRGCHPVDPAPTDPWRASTLPEPRPAPRAAERRRAETPRPQRHPGRRRRPRGRARAGLRCVRRDPAGSGMISAWSSDSVS